MLWHQKETFQPICYYDVVSVNCQQPARPLVNCAFNFLVGSVICMYFQKKIFARFSTNNISRVNEKANTSLIIQWLLSWVVWFIGLCTLSVYDFWWWTKQLQLVAQHDLITLKVLVSVFTEHHLQAKSVNIFKSGKNMYNLE